MIYQLWQGDFHDITSGATGNVSDPNEYSAMTGDDVASGRGTPVANLLVPALANVAYQINTGIPQLMAEGGDGSVVITFTSGVYHEAAGGTTWTQINTCLDNRDYPGISCVGGPYSVPTRRL